MKNLLSLQIKQHFNVKIPAKIHDIIFAMLKDKTTTIAVNTRGHFIGIN